MKSNTFKFPDKSLAILLFCLLILFSCKKEEQFPADLYEINSFIYNQTKDFYLWTQYVPADINVKNFQDPNELFDELIYKPLDRWSFVYDDYQEILNSLNGIEKTQGYKLQLFRFSDSNGVFGIIEYVYAGGPAEGAGLQRGDVILSVNGQMLNVDNYDDLINLDVMQLGLGEIVGNQVVDLHTSVTVTAVEMTINPVLQYHVIDTAGTKIGYLLYDQFISDFDIQLQNAISALQAQGITELVLDLRFNPGGYLSTCSKLAGMIAPAGITDIFIYQQWNDNITADIIATEGSESEYLVTKFPTVPVKLDLSRLVVLTSSGTASASETLINGLKPYMNVVTIGETTHGKYTGAIPFYDDKSTVNHWLLYLVVNKIANSEGETDFVNGFTPDYPVDDDYVTPLGDASEPLLAKAIEVITGTPARKSAFTVKSKPVGRYYRNPLKRSGITILDPDKVPLGSHNPDASDL